MLAGRRDGPRAHLRASLRGWLRGSPGPWMRRVVSSHTAVASQVCRVGKPSPPSWSVLSSVAVWGLGATWRARCFHHLTERTAGTSGAGGRERLLTSGPTPWQLGTVAGMCCGRQRGGPRDTGVRDRGRPQRVSDAPPGLGAAASSRPRTGRRPGPPASFPRGINLPPSGLSSLPHASISACLSHNSLGQMSCLKRSRRFLCT